MKKMFLSLGVASLMLVASTAVFALPTVGSLNETTLLNALLSGSGSGPGAAFTLTGGATGGLQVPTADIEAGKVLAVDRSELEVARIPSMRFLAGVSKDLEVGVGYEDIALNAAILGGPDEELVLSTTSINAKYALPVKLANMKVAIGANYNMINADDLLTDLDSTNIYLAGTMPVGSDSKMSANITYTTVDIDGGSIDPDNDFTFGLGYEKAFENDTVVGVEAVLSAGDLMSSAADSVNYLNIYLNVPINEKMTGRVALSGIGQYTTTNVGLAYGF